MSSASRRLAGILLVIFPTVLYGGASLLRLIVEQTPGYQDNPVRESLWRAGHAHAGVFLLLALVLLRYVDVAALSPAWRSFVRYAAPIGAILIPGAFFLSILSPNATRPGELIVVAYLGGIILAAGLVTLGIGLLRRAPDRGVDL
jgi:hypothetical protein